MINSLVSIIIPCYNTAQFVDETLISVFNQTYTNWEAIIVNDGSPDNVDEVAQKWIDKDDRFKYFKKQNGGLADARNYGIHKSNGEYILPLDSDDTIEKTFLEKTVPILKNNAKVEVVSTQVLFFGAREGVFQLEDFSFNYLLTKNCIVATSLFRRNTFNNVGGYNTKLKSLEDWDLWIAILKNGGDVYKIEEPLFNYRIREGGSLINNLFNNKDVYKEYHDIIFKRHSDAFLKHIGNPILIKRELDNLKAEINKPLKVKFIDALKKVYAKILGK